ncbi:hypothetical protein LEMLEM_LOCUS23908, partial [Lemmus lemmus]
SYVAQTPFCLHEIHGNKEDLLFQSSWVLCSAHWRLRQENHAFQPNLGIFGENFSAKPKQDQEDCSAAFTRPFETRYNNNCPGRSKDTLDTCAHPSSLICMLKQWTLRTWNFSRRAHSGRRDHLKPRAIGRRRDLSLRFQRTGSL